MSQPNPKPRKPGFPAQPPVLRRALARDDICPECGWELDTGWSTSTGIGTTFTGGKVGVGPVVSTTPAKTGYLCDDGMTYWR